MELTGVFLPRDKQGKVEELLRPKISFSLGTGTTTITEPGNQEDARKVVQDFAIENGFPPLPEGQYYGLTNQWELVAPN